MTEGPRTVVTQSRLTEFDFLDHLEALTIAVQKVSTITRLHQTEHTRLAGNCGSIHQAMSTWQHAMSLLADAGSALERAHGQIVRDTLQLGRALRATEESSV